VTAPSRPPSEQGVEYETLDALQELRDQVAELAGKPLFLAQGNWWDVLPRFEDVCGRQQLGGWKEVFAQYASEYVLPCPNPSLMVAVRIQSMTDRLELTLRLNHMLTLWQRALFFDEGPRG
jgi:hypothetical protein